MNIEFDNYQNWHNRGYIPHYEANSKYQIITYRLADSLPQELLHRQKKDTSHERALYRKYIEDQLDLGYGSCLLRNDDVAEKVLDAWEFYNGKKYDLVSWVIMPNHVHVLIKTYEEISLGKIVWSWKRFVTTYVSKNKKLKAEFLEHFEKLEAFKENAAKDCGAPGRVQTSTKFTFWQREYWDRFIRDQNHFLSAINYIHDNPVKAGLTKTRSDWQWSSYSKL